MASVWHAPLVMKHGEAGREQGHVSRWWRDSEITGRLSGLQRSELLTRLWRNSVCFDGMIISDPTGSANISDKGYISALAFDKGGSLLAAASSSSEFFVYDMHLATAQGMCPDSLEDDMLVVKVKYDRLGKVENIVWNPRNQNEVAVCTGVQGSAFVYDLERCGNRPTRTYNSDSNNFVDVSFLQGPSSNLLAGGSRNGSTYIWDISSPKRPCYTLGPRINMLTKSTSGPVLSITGSIDGRLVVTGTGTGCINVYDLRSDRFPIQSLSVPELMGNSRPAITPRGNKLPLGLHGANPIQWVEIDSNRPGDLLAYSTANGGILCRIPMKNRTTKCTSMLAMNGRNAAAVPGGKDFSRTRPCMRNMDGYSNVVTCAPFDGIAISDMTSPTHIAASQNFQRQYTTHIPTGTPIAAVASHPKQNYLAAGASGNRVLMVAPVVAGVCGGVEELSCQALTAIV